MWRGQAETALGSRGEGDDQKWAMVASVIAAALAFVATNVDDLFVLLDSVEFRTLISSVVARD
jgi:hypothetical protein